MLCDLLTDTRLAGKPESYFMEPFYFEWATHWRVVMDSWNSQQEFDQEYINAAIHEGMDGTGVFGLRVQWRSLDGLMKRLSELHPNVEPHRELLFKVFGTKHYIHLIRRNKVAQAVSLLKAEQSGLWHLHANGKERERLKNGEKPEYDFLGIKKHYDALQEHDRAWKVWFKLQEIQPVCLAYEDLVSDPRASLSSVFLAMGMDNGVPDQAHVRTMRMANEESDVWIRRFIAESKLNPN